MTKPRGSAHRVHFILDDGYVRAEVECPFSSQGSERPCATYDLDADRTEEMIDEGEYPALDECWVEQYVQHSGVCIDEFTEGTAYLGSVMMEYENQGYEDDAQLIMWPVSQPRVRREGYKRMERIQAQRPRIVLTDMDGTNERVV